MRESVKHRQKVVCNLNDNDYRVAENNVCFQVPQDLLM